MYYVFVYLLFIILKIKYSALTAVLGFVYKQEHNSPSAK